VLKLMRDKGWMLGGESSGHIICGDVATTGDGVVSALQVVNALHILAEPLAQAKKGMIKLPQKMINVRLAQKISITSNAIINEAVLKAEIKLAGKGRVLLRPSGTEPLIRVMVEGEDVDLVDNLAKQLADVVSSEVGL
jgi:phosphoglucosamine mutase